MGESGSSPATGSKTLCNGLIRGMEINYTGRNVCVASLVNYVELNVHFAFGDYTGPMKISSVARLTVFRISQINFLSSF